MYIIAGLGNPTDKYKGTRHNAGFEVIDRLASRYNIDMNSKKFKGIAGSGVIEGSKAVLLKPQTFMNLSGESVREAMDFYKCDISELIVIYDDISLEPGSIRIREKGSAGGHNGMKNIILHCGSQDFARVRVGVGEKPAHMDLADYVLGHFSKEEQQEVDRAFDNAVKAVGVMLSEGTQAAMNQYNRK